MMHDPGLIRYSVSFVFEAWPYRERDFANVSDRLYCADCAFLGIKRSQTDENAHGTLLQNDQERL
jgi:hypothetical protein